ncbi:MAG: DegT/DnrJ/EryC1/StrS family aminotransferase [Nitrososphaerales archaeon]|nr:DegT/DnrJ/EryC1/StrS family aminotransferase [Nitrososphaerales archaeon]
MVKFKIKLAEPMISDEEKEAIFKVLSSGRFVMGEQNRYFEREFANFLGIKYAVAVSSGTAALHLALLACGVKEGDEVITVSHTFVSTVSMIIACGAKPVLVDIDPKFYTMDPNEVEKAITNKTKAIIPVHLYGHPVDLDPIMEIAEKHGLYVIEDAAQAHGAEYKGKKVGGLGHIGCFSFYPSKNMMVGGEGGMVVTDDEDLERDIRMLANHGRSDKDTFVKLGYNYRMSEIHAAIGRIQLMKLKNMNEIRRRIARRYSKGFEGINGLITPIEAPWAYHVYHIYAIRCNNRDRLREWLNARYIETGIHYRLPVHHQPFYTSLQLPSYKLPFTEEVTKTVLSLPIHPNLKDDDIDYIIENVRGFFIENR